MCDSLVNFATLIAWMCFVYFVEGQVQVVSARFALIPDFAFTFKYWASGETEKCSVCLDDMGPGDAKTITLVQCRHALHHACAELWFKRGATCPMCRAPVCIARRLVPKLSHRAAQVLLLVSWAVVLARRITDEGNTRRWFVVVLMDVSVWCLLMCGLYVAERTVRAAWRDVAPTFVIACILFTALGAYDGSVNECSWGTTLFAIR